MNERKGFRFPTIYYGWVLLAVAMIAGSFSTGAGVWGASVMARPMTEALGWSRASYFGALTVRSLVAGALAPIVGPIQDTRNGPRRLMLMSAVLLGVSLILTRWVDSLWQFYLLFGLMGGIAQVSGINALTRVILPKWFVRRRGRVLGLAAMGPGLGPMLFPISIQTVIDLFDWREAWFVLGLAALCILVPVSFMVRTRPEDMGLLPDGDKPDDPPPAREERAPTPPPLARPTREVEGLTVRESLRTMAFWLIVGAFMLVGLGMGGFHANLVTYFQDIGLAAQVAALSGTAFAIASVALRPVWGLLAERFSVRWLIGPQLILSAGTVLLILNVGGQTSMLIAAALHGLTIGAYITLQGLLVADYFGRSHLGAINGVMRPFMTGAGAISPVLIAFLFDLQDSYTTAFLIIASAWVIAGGLMLLAAPPRQQPGPEPALGGAAPEPAG
ncbi:MAG: MFS transporter [Chloroflexota bacterium]|nr:MFS transporter [Chloroflexota bacterium]MDE2968626.1 MFS transporter [Chloroflexota bacterium]